MVVYSVVTGINSNSSHNPATKHKGVGGEHSPWSLSMYCGKKGEETSRLWGMDGRIQGKSRQRDRVARSRGCHGRRVPSPYLVHRPCSRVHRFHAVAENGPMGTQGLQFPLPVPPGSSALGSCLIPGQSLSVNNPYRPGGV